MKIIEYQENNGKYNMDFDSLLLEKAIKEQSNEPVLRFYGWKPACVSIGRNQSENSINSEYCNQNGIDIVKRVTGGRALLHDDEVTYSFICPIHILKNGESVILSYKEISSAIIRGFQTVNIDLELGGSKKKAASHDYCMLLSTGADLSYNGKKLIGSAQYRTQGYILQHGSVLFSYSEDVIEKIFNEKTQSTITCMKEINSNLTRQDIVTAMTIGFQQQFN